MKQWKNLSRHLAVLVAVVAGAWLLAGCATNPPVQHDSSGEPAYTAFQPGEALIISFSDTVNPIQPFEGRVKEDGIITLMENQEFKASGKTAGQLEKEIRERYVPRYFVKMTVTVKSMDRFFYVNGQVRMPGRYEYRGDITVSGAIAAAGGFTEFAQKTKVRISRANNKTEVVNMEKAIHDPKLDLPVYPRDRIEVPRKVW